MKNMFTPEFIVIDGTMMPAEYSVSSTGRTVTAWYTLSGQRFKVRISGECGEIFDAAKRAAQRGDSVEVDGEGLMLVLGESQALEERKPAAAPDPAKAARGPVPEKWFIGQEFTGKRWRILFDGDAGKTRVIFERKPSRAVIDAVKAAGFYWSPSMGSWNKGLNFRAYRAAEQLRLTLGALIV